MCTTKDKIRPLSRKGSDAKYFSKIVSVLAEFTSERKDMVDNGKLNWADFKKMVCCTCQ